jgi:hypothetical protein
MRFVSIRGKKREKRREREREQDLFWDDSINNGDGVAYRSVEKERKKIGKRK